MQEPRRTVQPAQPPPPGGPPPWPYAPPPPVANRDIFPPILIILVILIVVGIVFSAVLALLVLTLITGSGILTAPTVALGPVGLSGGNATFDVTSVSASSPIDLFEVNLAVDGSPGGPQSIGRAPAYAGASQSVSPSNYRVNLQVGTMAGTAVAMPTTGGAFAVVVVGGTTYQIYWTDIGGELTVNSGENFRITGNGVALPAASDFTVYLLRSNGSQVQSVVWTTP